MDKATCQLIERIHVAGRRFVLIASGGGSRAISDLLTVPGGSRTLLEAVVPYSAAAVVDWLGATPDQYCSERTARAISMAAFERARALAPHDAPAELAGIGCTASLISDRPKRGSHRVHVAWQTAGQTVVESFELKKGGRDRAGEEQVAASMILNAIAAAFSCGDAADSTSRSAYGLPGEQLLRRSQTALPEWTELLLGGRDVAYDKNIAPFNPNPKPRTGNSDPHPFGMAAAPISAAANGPLAPRVVFPGAFNPLHAGHRRMAEIGAQRTGEPVWFEISMTNVDKPPLDFIEIADRFKTLAGLPAVLTRAARFTEKAALFPGATFIVGADTIERIADPRYYAGDPARAAAAIRSIVALGCRFLVFGRRIGGEFVGADDFDLPAELRRRCIDVPEAQFRDDVSSTELRKKAEERTSADRATVEASVRSKPAGC